MPNDAPTPATLAPGAMPRPEDLDTCYVALLYRGPAYDDFPPTTPEQLAVVGAHVAHVWRQQHGGAAVAGGPLMSAPDDATAPVGLTVLRAASSAEAEALAREDPGVAAGRFTVAVYPWIVARGRLPG